jgi:DNA polymerase (family X)
VPGAKQEIVALLRELRELTLLDEQDANAFRVRAYEKAVLGLSPVGDDIASMSEKELQAIPGIGKSTAAKIREFFLSGRIGGGM